MPLKLEALYRDHLELSYTCIDRIYLRGYVSLLQTCGGFRCWAEKLCPNEPVTQSWIHALVRRFHVNVKRFADEHGIPVLQAEHGMRKHLVADEHRARFKGEGVYLIIRGPEKAKVVMSQDPKEPTSSNHRNLDQRLGFVTHYTFFIVDRLWGPISVVLCSHPPFNVKVFLNAHHWVERQAAARKLMMTTETNAFLGTTSPELLQQIVDRLGECDIRRVADRWVYRVLPILSYKERNQTRFQYDWCIAQIEYSHNLVFHASFPLGQLFQRHIDLNRRMITPHSIATVFGKRKNTRGTEKTSLAIYQQLRTRTVMKVRHFSSVIKQYNKHERILRTECVCNDPYRFGVGKRLSNFSQLRWQLAATLVRFQELQEAVVDTTLDRGELAALAQTSELGKGRVPGIRLDNERMMNVIRLLGRLATDPRGFTTAQLRDDFVATFGKPYSAAQAAYDLRKLRAKSLLCHADTTRRYVFTARGARIAALLFKLRDLIVGPTLAIAASVVNAPQKVRPGPKPQEIPRERVRTLLAKHAGNLAAVARDLDLPRITFLRHLKREHIDVEDFRRPVPSTPFEEAYDQVHRALDRLTETVDLRFAA
ncbi:MAG TPA: hypothetical protein VIV65_00685 [Gemmatimonadaceae bacterium]|jgi:hypothetical protein